MLFYLFEVKTNVSLSRAVWMDSQGKCCVIALYAMEGAIIELFAV